MNRVAAIPHMNVHTSDFEPFPRMNGTKRVLYHSPDGTRLAASFTESGRHTMTMPFDEFAYVVRGTAVVTVLGGETYEFGAGDAFYLLKGMTVDFELSDDFQDIAFLVSEEPIPRP